jgi:hypothetical protein
MKLLNNLQASGDSYVNGKLRVGSAVFPSYTFECGGTAQFDGPDSSKILRWDSTTGRLGVWNSSPTHAFDLGGSIGAKVTTVTGTTSLDETHLVVIGNSSSSVVTLNLPQATSSIVDRMYFIANKNTQNVSIHPYSGERINGETADYIVQKGGSVIVVCDATSNWRTLVFSTTDSGGAVAVKPAFKLIQPDAGTYTYASPYTYTVPDSENGYTYFCKPIYGTGAIFMKMVLPAPSTRTGYKYAFKAIGNTSDTADGQAVMIVSSGTGYTSTGENILSPYGGAERYIGQSTANYDSLASSECLVIYPRLGSYSSYFEGLIMVVLRSLFNEGN